MDDSERKPNDLSSLMATVASIVETVLEGQGLTLLTQLPSPWKAAQREDLARDHEWRALGWNRA